MIHKNRPFNITDIGSTEELADQLVDRTWTSCTGFRLGGYLFLNDSFGPDGAQEYAAVRESDGAQVESITFSWCSIEEAIKYIRQILSPENPHTVYSTVDPKSHPEGACSRCA